LLAERRCCWGGNGGNEIYLSVDRSFWAPSPLAQRSGGEGGRDWRERLLCSGLESWFGYSQHTVTHGHTPSHTRAHTHTHTHTRRETEVTVVAEGWVPLAFFNPFLNTPLHLLLQEESLLGGGGRGVEEPARFFNMFVSEILRPSDQVCLRTRKRALCICKRALCIYQIALYLYPQKSLLYSQKTPYASAKEPFVSGEKIWGGYGQ